MAMEYEVGSFLPRLRGGKFGKIELGLDVYVAMEYEVGLCVRSCLRGGKFGKMCMFAMWIGCVCGDGI